MNPILQQEYNNYFEMFRTAGWKQFIEDMQEALEGYAIEDIKDGEHLALVKGEMRMLKQVLQFQWAIEMNFELLEDEDDDQTL